MILLIIVLTVIGVYHSVKADIDDCSRNETYLECGPNCEKTCSNLQGDCNTFDLLICPGGCYCISGFVRNLRGNCVLESDCDDAACGRNEIYLTCGPGCDIYCDDLTSCNTNLFDKCTADCYCAPRFIRNRVNNNCIRQTNCNKRI